MSAPEAMTGDADPTRAAAAGSTAGGTNADGVLGTVRLEVVRLEPGEQPGPGGPRTSVYEVPYAERTTVLDALTWAKDNLDPTLTFRWSCRMAICGSCGVMVNGRPMLGCETFVRGYRTSGLKVGPLAHFEVLRDLVVETDGFLGKVASLSPWLLPDDDAPPDDVPVDDDVPEDDAAPDDAPPGPAPAAAPRPTAQSPAELAAYLGFAQCIDCMLCYSACPQVGEVPGFVGPAAVATARRWDLDSRDRGDVLRMNAMDVEEGIWPCTQDGSCTQVCPKGVDPARALRDAQRIAEETWEARQG